MDDQSIKIWIGKYAIVEIKGQDGLIYGIFRDGRGNFQKPSPVPNQENLDVHFDEVKNPTALLKDFQYNYRSLPLSAIATIQAWYPEAI